MNADVLLQVAFLHESFVAVGTVELLFSRVNLQVRVERGPVPELFRAEVAVEPLFTGMDHMVELQVGCRLEGFATHLALEWPVVTVNHALVASVHLLAVVIATNKQ